MFLKYKKYWFNFLTILLVIFAMTLSGIEIKNVGGETKYSISIGTVAAAGRADYIATGANDNGTWQTALNTLPTSGRKLIGLAGNYVFANNIQVTRTIGNVTIEGVGPATSISGDGVHPTFTAGGDNWVFKDIKFDVAPDMGSTTGWIWYNVWVGIIYYKYRCAEVGNNTNFNANLVDGYQAVKTSSYVVVASDASPSDKAQADYVCDGSGDATEINAAITAGTGNHNIVTVEGGTFSLNNPIIMVNNLTLVLQDCVITSPVNSTDYFIGDNSTKVVGIGIVFNNAVIDCTGANYGLLFETAGDEITLKGHALVKYANNYNYYFRKSAKINFDVIEAVGFTDPIDTERNSCVNLISCNDVNGNQIIVTNGGNDAELYGAIRIFNSDGYIQHGHITDITSTGNNSAVVLAQNLYDYTFDTIHVVGNNMAPGIPDGIDIMNGAHDITIGNMILENNGCNGLVFGGGGGGKETYAVTVNTAIVKGSGGISVVIGQDTDELVHDISIGKLIVCNGGAQQLTSHQYGLAFENAYNVQIGQYIAYDNQDNATQLYPLQFRQNNRHAINNIQFGLTDFSGSPHTLPVYNVTPTNVTGETFPFVNTGTATVANGNSTVVPHELGFTPSKVYVTPTNSMGNATKYYVGNITSSQFTIYVDTDPGATTATFAWKATVGNN